MDKSRAKKSNALLGASLIVFVLFMAVIGAFTIDTSIDSEGFGSNTTINNVNVSGLSYEEAVSKLSQELNRQANDFSLELKYNDKTWTFDKDDFTVTSDIHTIIEEAEKRDSINSDYEYQLSTIADIKNNGKDLVVAFNYLFVGLDDKIDAIVDEINVAPTNSTIGINSDLENIFVITDEMNGIAVDKTMLYDAINNEYSKSNSVSIEIPATIVLPEITREYNETLTNLKASYSTNVSDSTGNRKYNVSKALKALDGLVVAPYETISFNEITGPHTSANGYKVATIIYDGKFTDGVGGGICQASTTLYNALLLSGLEINEVHKHTLPVKYVPLALDAMVSEGSSDMRFTNNSEDPIIIHTYSDSNKVYVEIYGTDMGNVSYKTNSEVLAEIKAKDVTEVDYDKKYSDKVVYQGEKYRVTYPRNGYEVQATLEKYEGDTLISSEVIREEKYRPQDGLVVEGSDTLYTGYFE